MISKHEFDGGLIYGPKTFAEITGRDKVWASRDREPIETAKRNCPICDHDEADMLFRTKEHTPKPGCVESWDYSGCRNCGMTYTVNAPTEEALSKLYRQGAAQQEWVHLQENKIELDLDFNKFQWALEKIGWPFGKRHILDIGCSTGTLLAKAQEMVPEDKSLTVAGVEINQEALGVAVQRCVRGKGVFVNQLEDINKKNGYGYKFDLIILWEVLEHVLDPRAMFKQALSFLSEGGKLLICVPNMGSMAARILHERAPMFGLGHINMFDPETLENFISDVRRPKWNGVKMETIISWQRECENWMRFKEPMSDDARHMKTDEHKAGADLIHQHNSGYKLVAFVET